MDAVKVLLNNLNWYYSHVHYNAFCLEAIRMNHGYTKVVRHYNARFNNFLKHCQERNEVVSKTPRDEKGKLEVLKRSAFLVEDVMRSRWSSVCRLISLKEPPRRAPSFIPRTIFCPPTWFFGNSLSLSVHSHFRF